jgi:CRISPR/Cas system-associated endoribonuclease Cas2
MCGLPGTLKSEIWKVKHLRRVQYSVLSGDYGRVATGKVRKKKNHDKRREERR